ncbi:hypothetical protein KZZ52_58735 [Dactylosporangium sp. AC04546]|uniref:hypothetical protein n=1 Tax=Dactylosporangium sp. AC04546 TaxID=2862460 RepID=UPI001EDEF9DF|nr:hypothetical protein [Dactylosporangium sp. AC04546]WVK83630.1 hypothetical protein KZZ52_58735 [Dactylosporangium sp. AC04546]
MTHDHSWLDAVLASLGKRDPFGHALWEGLTLPAPKAVRSRFVIALVAHLHDSLTDSFVTQPEAYQTFVRTISTLNASLLHEGRRR